MASFTRLFKLSEKIKQKSQNFYFATFLPPFRRLLNNGNLFVLEICLYNTYYLSHS